MTSWWFIVNWAFRNKLQWDTEIFIQETWLKISSAKCWPFCSGPICFKLNLQHWKPRITMMPISLSLAKVVITATSATSDNTGISTHDDVIKWKHFPCYWPFVRGIHRSPVNSPHKGQWRGALMFSLICVWINGWISNGEAGDLRRYHAHYDVTVMFFSVLHWHHNERDGISNHQLLDCLLNCLFRCMSKKTPKLHITGLCEGNSPVTGEFPAQRSSYAENVSIWWHHHAVTTLESWQLLVFSETLLVWSLLVFLPRASKVYMFTTRLLPCYHVAPGVLADIRQ